MFDFAPDPPGIGPAAPAEDRPPAPPPPDLPGRAARLALEARPLTAFGTGAPPLHALR